MVDKTSYVNINRLFYQWTIHQIFSCNYSWKKKQETLEDKRHTNWWNIRQSRPMYGWKTQVSQAQWLSYRPNRLSGQLLLPQFNSCIRPCNHRKHKVYLSTDFSVKVNDKKNRQKNTQNNWHRYRDIQYHHWLHREVHSGTQIQL